MRTHKLKGRKRKKQVGKLRHGTSQIRTHKLERRKREKQVSKLEDMAYYKYK